MASPSPSCSSPPATTICHSRTRGSTRYVSRADVLVAAVGRPEMVTGDWSQAEAS